MIIDGAVWHLDEALEWTDDIHRGSFLSSCLLLEKILLLALELLLVGVDGALKSSELRLKLCQ